MEKRSLQAGIGEESIQLTDVNRSGWRRRHLSAVMRVLLLATALSCYFSLTRVFYWTASSERDVRWVSCGDGLGEEFQCANISVPLDYRNSSDERTYQIAVVRLLASDEKNRKGAVFINPGGPGGSGTGSVKRGKSMARVFKGQYDLIGFDPRGVKSSQPYMSCFNSAMEDEAFAVSVNGFSLNLPANVSAFTPGLRDDLGRQVDSMSASMTSLARRCVARSEDVLPYFGTEFVVRDIDYLARLIEGEDKRINYWGFSYGTVIGQYMVKILPPERLGRLIIDGVVNPTLWNQHASACFDQGLQDIDNVLFSFASSCLAAGANCTLNADAEFSSTSSLLAKIDATIDALYDKPVPVYGLDVPAVATAANLRAMMFHSLYSVSSWGGLAERLSEAFKGDFKQLVNSTMPRIHSGSESQSDPSTYATQAILCADSKAYWDSGLHPSPTNAELTDRILANLKTYSRRFGDGHWSLALCHLWAEAGLPPSRSRYAGTFELEDNTLDTPMLVLSNTYDPVTPLEHAMMANQRLGNNARLIQQTGGFGHCTVNHFSYCTALATQEYMLYGIIPEQKHTACKIDQVPFEPFERMVDFMGGGERTELSRAWLELSKELDL